MALKNIAVYFLSYFFSFLSFLILFMAFHGNDLQDRYKWYQSPHLGLSPAGYDGGISGGHYSHYPAYPLYTQSNFTQPNPYPPPFHHHFVHPNPYSPPQNYHPALLINGHLLPQQFPCISHSHGQPSQPSACSQPIYPITQHPTHHSPQPNTNLWIYPQVSPISSPPLTSHQQQTSHVSDVKPVEPDLHLGSISREPDRVQGLEGPFLNSGCSSFRPEPMDKPKESGSQLSSTRGSGELPDDKLCATQGSLKKSMDTFMSEFKEELRLLRDSWKLQTSHVDSALKKFESPPFESPPQWSTLEPCPATTEASSVATLSSIVESVSTAINAGLDLSQHEVILGFINEMGTEVVASAASKVSTAEILDLCNDNSAIVVSGNNCEDDISADMIDSNKMGANSRSMEFGIYNTKLPAVTINSIGNLHEVREFYEMESVSAKNDEMIPKLVLDDDDDPPDKEHSDGIDGSENDVNQPVSDGSFQVSQSTCLSGGPVVYSNVHGLEVSLESDICRNKSSLVSEDIDSKEAVKIIKEHIMGCTRPPNDCQLDVHKYEQLSFVTVEKELSLKVKMVHKKIWKKWKSIHVGLASVGNAKELDSIVMEGLKFEGMKMCFVDKLSEAKFWQWLILCHWVKKKHAIFHREAFDKVGDPLSQSQVLITVALNSRACESFLCILITFYAMFCGAFNDGSVLSDDTIGIMVRKAKLVDDYMIVLAKMLTGSVNKEWVRSNASMINIIITALCGKRICSSEQHVKMQDVRMSFLSVLLTSIHTLIKREPTSIIQSLPYHIDHQVETWNIIHVMIYEEEFLLVLFGKPRIMKVEALTDTNLRINDAANKQTPQFFAFSMCIVHFGMEQTGCADALSSPDTIVSMGMWGRNVVSWSAILVGLEFNHNIVVAFLYAHVKGSCGVGLSISGKYLIWDFAADDSKIETNLDKMSKDENYNKSAEDIWGIVGLVLGLTNSVGAMYKAGVRDVSLKCEAAQLQSQRNTLNNALGDERSWLLFQVLFPSFILKLMKGYWQVQLFSPYVMLEVGEALIAWKLPHTRGGYSDRECPGILTETNGICVACVIIPPENADLASEEIEQSLFLNDCFQVLDFSTDADDNLDVLLHDLGDNTLAAPHVLYSTIHGMLNTSAAAFDNSMASPLVNIIDSAVATLLGSLLIFGTLLICTVEFYISVPIVGRSGQVLQETSRLEDKPVL